MGCDYLLECSQLIEKNSKKIKNVIPLQRGGIVKVTFDGKLNGSKLAKMLSDLSAVIKIYKSGCKKIVFTCNGTFKPQDMFTYVLFECVLYTLMMKNKYEIEVKIHEVETTIHTPGLRDSMIVHFIQNKFNLVEIEKKYKSIFNRNHFRRIISASDLEQASVLLGDLKTFFRFHDIDLEYGKQISKVISELVDNASDHSDSDCLADIFISDPTYKKKGDDNDYYVISMVILNFSNKQLGDDVKRKILKKEYNNAARYDNVNNAYKNHKQFFSDRGYNEEDFFNITSFQDKISGRKHESTTGGTGLTALIKSLEDKAEAHSCYVLSGQQGLWFEPEFLEYNDDNWIGFNKENDFLNCEPCKEVLLRSSVNFMGTGYNFTLVVRKEGKENEGN